MKTILLMLLVAVRSVCGAVGEVRPNVVWIVVEDMSADFSCYRDVGVKTPAVDGLAAEGTKFVRAYVTAPICSICRSAPITGRYQTSLGAHPHRSSVPGQRIQLPAGGMHVPELMREDG